MKRALIVCVALAALTVPAVSSAAVSQTDFKNAAKFCKALRADMGATTFKQTFGTNKTKSNAHGKCVSKHARTMDDVHSDAVKNCRAERDADPVAFASKYGTGKNKKNAFGKCVSQARADLKAEARLQRELTAVLTDLRRWSPPPDGAPGAEAGAEEGRAGSRRAPSRDGGRRP